MRHNWPTDARSPRTLIRYIAISSVFRKSMSWWNGWSRQSSRTDVSFLSTGAVMIEAESAGRPPDGTWDLADGIYAAYVSFFPGMPDAIRTAAEWLGEIYVHELLDGRVLTDFDEQVRRFGRHSIQPRAGDGRANLQLQTPQHVLGRCACLPRLDT